MIYKPKEDQEYTVAVLANEYLRDVHEWLLRTFGSVACSAMSKSDASLELSEMLIKHIEDAWLSGKDHGALDERNRQGSSFHAAFNKCMDEITGAKKGER